MGKHPRCGKPRVTESVVRGAALIRQADVRSNWWLRLPPAKEARGYGSLFGCSAADRRGRYVSRVDAILSYRSPDVVLPATSRRRHVSAFSDRVPEPAPNGR